MSIYSSELLLALQQKAERIRNICILAHVDHGKTTLSDSLISTNGIISRRLAGTVRYMDSRPDEQERMITMKSSCITLLHRYALELQPGTEKTEKGFLVNLIDSPGHVDFGMEVSTAVRVCDGALVLIDVVEGVSSQTRSVLRQAWMEKVRPTLVLNKFDRLITDLQLSPLEAYEHISRILEQANVVMSEFNAGDVFEKLVNDDAVDMGDDDMVDFDWDETMNDDGLYFSPTQGNVVFASAYDGWAFSIKQFVELFANKLGCKKEVLTKTLWGPFCYNAKQKKIVKGTGKPMFVSMILENIWAVYEASRQTGDKSRIEKVVKALNLKVPPRDLKHKDPKVVMKGVMGGWLPLATAILDMVVESLPSPLESQEVRLPKIAPLLAAPTTVQKSASARIVESGSSASTIDTLRDAVCKCSTSGEVVVYVAKMFSVPRTAIPAKEEARGERGVAPREKRPVQATRSPRKEGADEGGDLYERVTETVVVEPRQAAPQESRADAESRSDTAPKETEDVLIGLCRIFCGTIKRGQQIHVLGPKYDPAFPDRHRSTIEVESLFVLMGRDLMYAESISAGAVFGIGGLDNLVARTATLSTSLACPSFLKLQETAPPIVRVAVEPKVPDFSNMSVLREGLRRLNQSDPGVECTIQESGELVVAASGELHLERCLLDLRETFAKIDISVSPPLVSFRETVMNKPTDTAESTGDNDTIGEATTANKLCSIYVRAWPMPAPVIAYLEKNAQLLRTTFAEDGSSIVGEEAMEAIRKELCDIVENLDDTMRQAPFDDSFDVHRVMAFGPNQCGPNMLINNLAPPNSSALPVLWPSGDSKENETDGADKAAALNGESELSGDPAPRDFLRNVQQSIRTGFQMATVCGPLCEEPLMGVCFTLEHVRVHGDLVHGATDQYGPLRGQVMSTMNAACRAALGKQPLRLMEAVFLCNMQAHVDSLGRFFGVLNQRRGKVLKEEMREGTMVFNIQCLLPVIESFGLADSLRSRTSGLAVPQMTFDSFRLIEMDPFWVPTTPEEIEHYGDKGDEVVNVARKYMNDVRRRKGLAVEEKLVEHADKQRTLKKNK